MSAIMKYFSIFHFQHDDEWTMFQAPTFKRLICKYLRGVVSMARD
jgi:hypothetical protein